MSIATLETQITSLENKVDQLVEKMEALREENTILKIKVSKQDDIIKDFQNNGKLTNIVGSIGSTGEDAEKLKLRIDENIQLIEKCIARLSENEADI